MAIDNDDFTCESGWTVTVFDTSDAGVSEVKERDNTTSSVIWVKAFSFTCGSSGAYAALGDGTAHFLAVFGDIDTGAYTQSAYFESPVKCADATGIFTDATAATHMSGFIQWKYGT